MHDEIIVIANPDVDFEENVIKEIQETFEKKPEYAVLSGIMHNSDGEQSASAYLRVPGYWQDVFLCFYIYNRIYSYKYPMRINYTNDIMEVDAVMGSMWAVRSDMLRKINYLDEGTFLFYEEFCTAMRIRAAGRQWKIGLLTKVSYIHRHSITIKKNFSMIKTYKVYMSSKKYFERKYHNISPVKRAILNIATKVSIMEEYIWIFIQIQIKRRKSEKGEKRYAD
jgi:GT2 family glycosyltransferase